MSTSQLQAKSSVDGYSALPEEDQHHMDALERAEVDDSTKLDSVEVSTPLPETAKTQKLCHYCEQMFSTIENLQLLASEEGYEHKNLRGLEEAGGRGCGLCKVIRKCYPRFKTGNSHMRVHARLVENRIENRLPISTRNSTFVEKHLLPRLRGSTILAEYPFDGYKIDRLTVNSPESPFNQICLLADEGSWAGLYIERQPLVAKDNFERIIPQIKKWLNDCHHHHSTFCRYSTPKLPTRVLQIESETTSLVRLHVSRPDQEDDYIALSYCWGGPQSFKTTASTLEHCMRGFDSNDLPLTLKDTIFIARSIGIRYIWIDALCIIQDNEVDKAREIEKMGDIYKNATITISAAGSTSIDGGLFNHEPTPELLEIPFCLPDKSLSKVYISSDVYHFESEDPLNRRAWCFQESILSPRLLSFRSTELIWQCQTLKFEPVVRSNHVYAWEVLQAPANVFRRDVAVEITDSFHRAKTWNWIVENFARRDLTNPEDRLPAISAIAKELALVWNDEHVFGFMRNTIEHHLSWEAQRFWCIDGKNLSNVRNRRVPSWSWVSVDFPINFTDMDAEIHVTCLEIDNTPTCGKIVLRAKVLSLEAHPMNSEQEEHFQDFYDFRENLKAEACTLMLLRERTSYKDGKCDQSFLILKRLSNGYYQRVGLFKCELYLRAYPLEDWMRPSTLRRLFKSIEMSRITII